ncbi:MAG TPA: RNA polymerase sigma factor [Thermoanaerobaculia bacterium]|jgi:RNA polymerase sigma-70 factor (ECF subfamily)|nr:RNA polymerase sigma factor [Thermoanaerobaculia bacterium]
MTIWKAGGGSRDELFEAIYRKYYARVWRLYRSSKVADDEAHDLAQDTFKRFYEHMPQFRGETEAVWSFLQVTARRLLLNRIRARLTGKRNGLHVDLDDPDLAFELAAPEEPDYAEREHQTLRRNRVRQAVAELTEGQQQVLRLWVQGLKYTQIAETLRVSVDAVKSRLRDAKKHLRARLGDDR